MARIRTIKPDFWTDEKLTECSLSARLLFIGTWNFADDSGNLDRSSKQIKARVFPMDSMNCEPLIQELIIQGLLIEYSCDCKKFLHIKGFLKHQLINRPSKPSCPEFDESLINQCSVSEHSLSTHARREGKEGKEDIATPSAKPSAPRRKKAKTIIPDEFSISESVSLWAEKNGYQLMEKRLEHFITACQAKGYEYADWDAAFRTAISDDWAKLGKATPKTDKPFDMDKFLRGIQS